MVAEENTTTINRSGGISIFLFFSSPLLSPPTYPRTRLGKPQTVYLKRMCFWHIANKNRILGIMRVEIEKRIRAAAEALGIAADGLAVEYIEDEQYWDIATNVALVGAKAAGASPSELAQRVVNELGEIAGVEKIEIAGPGFINFTLTAEALARVVSDIAAQPEAWGRNESKGTQEILLEYTSPNLFKPLHVGNLVGNIVGESLARLYENGGAQVRRINYPSDIGLTIAKGVWGLKKTGGGPSDIQALGEAYRIGNEAYETDSVAKEEIGNVNRALYSGTDEELNDLRARGIETSRKQLAELCRALGTKFDFEIFESEASPVGKEIVLGHVGRVFEKSEGAVVFPGERHGLHTRVFLNSQDLPTYEAKDLGNFKLKQEKYPEWTHSLVVTGREQADYFKVVYAAIREVFPAAKEKELIHISTGFLTLTTGKMSSRKGNVLTGESLFAELQESARTRAEESRAEDAGALGEQIAVAALKYEILKRNSGSDIVFDKERALSLEGDSGPYIQYAYARACSVVDAGKGEGVVAAAEPPQTDGERSIMRALMQFPDVVLRAQEELEPHYVAVYIGELASMYNSWYAQERVLGTPDAARRLAITEAVAVTLKNGLWLLGIQAPKRM